MADSAWKVVNHELTPAGRSYTVVLGEREVMVLHVPGGWQFYNMLTDVRCEPNAGVKAAVRAYERDEGE